MRTRVRDITFLAVALAIAAPAAGQSEPPAQHQHNPSSNTQPLFEAREASGTAWLPDDTPMYGIQKTSGAWDVMFHWNAFGQFLYEPGLIHRTGGFETHQTSSVNWLMVMPVLSSVIASTTRMYQKNDTNNPRRVDLII